MTCYFPMDGFRQLGAGPSGIKIRFSRRNKEDVHVQIPCGQCIGCRLEKSRQWALRCKHEASLHKNNCFITLTYDTENLPKNGTLVLKHFQLFIKRLRKKHGPNIRFFHCGEYGDNNFRPHYHAIIFNFDFKDKILWKIKNDNRYYISDELTKIWGLGHCVIGDVTFESAAYVARYCLKKLNGPKSHLNYLILDENNEIFYLSKEYATMSRRPGIGDGWYKKYKTDAYPSDFIIHDGVKMRPPKFYDGRLDIEDPKQLVRIKALRRQSAKKHEKDNTPERLAVRHTVQKARADLLKREHDNDP